MSIVKSMFKVLMASAFCFSFGINSFVSHSMEDLIVNWHLRSGKGYYYYDNWKKSYNGLRHMKLLGYQIISNLGSGHSGNVYKAKDPNGNICALKFTYDDITTIDDIDTTTPDDSRYKRKRYQGVEFVGDKVLYDSLKNDNQGIVDFGANACKILGYEMIPGIKDNDRETCNICVILEYIEGTPILDYVKKNEYKTTDILRWLKDICNSLNLMYEKNFLHRSVGVSNIMIKNGSAVLVDYEKSYFKKSFEDMLRRNGKLNTETNVYGSRYYDYYDLYLLYTSFINLLINDAGYHYNKNYICNNKELENELLDLEKTNTLEEFLARVEGLN